MSNATFYAVITAVYLSFLAFFSYLAAKMFEYCLWCMFEKDVPWYLDLAGAFVLNGVNVVIFIGCAIARACGVEVPFF